MTVLETNTIDIVAARSDVRSVKLVISDHLPWNDFDGHARLLQDKLNTYIAFVERGQWLRTNRSVLPDDPLPLIVITFLYVPTEPARELLGKVDTFLAGIGIGFEYEVRPDLGAGDGDP